MRLNPYALRPEVYQAVLAVSREIAKGTLERDLRCLVEVRVSQLNGCSFCLAMHSDGARAAGVPQSKLDTLAGWHDDGAFTARERAALGVAEAATNLTDHDVSDGVWNEASPSFTQEELADLLFLIGLVNLYNRLNVVTGFPAEMWRDRRLGHLAR